jgi:aspartate/methionine/tyrosine aminotransferase
VRYIRENSWGKNYIDNLRAYLREGFNEMKTGMEKLGFTIPKIDGGFFIWAVLPKGYEDGFRFTIDLYDQQKVAVIPGEHFSDAHRHYIRVNIAREHGELREALKRINRFVE